MKDKGIHDLIEQGNEERKKKSWQTIQSGFEQGTVVELENNGTNTAALLKSKKFVIPVTVVTVIIIALILTLALFDWDRPNNTVRFYQSDEYESAISDITLKEYSQQNNFDIIYFDWYAETDDYVDRVFLLKDTNEVICFQETIYDNNTDNSIIIFVTEKNVQLDFLSIYDYLTDSYNSNVGITVQWGGDSNKVFAKFECKGYTYYLQIDDIVGPKEDILRYVEMLLS